MAVEAKRGCGYRKVGGLYLVAGQLAESCGLFPLELHVCPVCASGIKQTRSWQWVNPSKLFAGAICDRPMRHDAGDYSKCATCHAKRTLAETTRAGLLWTGGKFYPTPHDFLKEGAAMGISRRISAIPRGFKVGETWVLIAHPLAVEREPRTDDERDELRILNEGLAADGIAPKTTLMRKGAICLFRPQRIEKIVTESESKDDAAMEELRERGITPVIVPDNDKDHQGSAHDKPSNGELFDDGEEA